MCVCRNGRTVWPSFPRLKWEGVYAGEVRFFFFFFRFMPAVSRTAEHPPSRPCGGGSSQARRTDVAPEVSERV